MMLIKEQRPSDCINPSFKQRAEGCVKNFATLVLFASVLGYLISRRAFSSGVAKEIREGGVCAGCGGKFAPSDLEAAHHNHSRNNGNYNSRSNGSALCTPCHYKDHYFNCENNGLSAEANSGALELIWKRLSRVEKRSLPKPDTFQPRQTKDVRRNGRGRRGWW
jgi:hypothetical protein